MEKVLFIRGQSHEPEFNIAAEEFLLKQREESFIYLWINSPAVIVGVNQNTAEEVRLDYTKKNGISVVRRMTGGGAVYHDLNNVCYTIIAPYDGERDNYRYFTSGVISYLNMLGVNAEFSGRNDVVVEGKKISGNAQCIYKNRIMHHGTLLFDTDVNVLTEALKPHRFKVESKGIKSVRARVTNIREHLKKDISAQAFFDGLCEYFKTGAEEYSFTKEDKGAIVELIKNKYSQFSWNVGSSPKAQFFAEKKFPYGIVRADFGVEDGKLQNVNLSGDFFSKKEINRLNLTLNGVLYKKEAVEAALVEVGEYIIGSRPDDIAELFFE